MKKTIRTFQNNYLNARLNVEFPHDFALCDIDGVSRKSYQKDGKRHTRLIMYETKWKSEKLTPHQLKTLATIQTFTDWSQFDTFSGVYVIRANDSEFNSATVYEVLPNAKVKYAFKAKLKSIYNWMSCKKPFV